MISCPKCQSSLPDWTQKCQFCGADTVSVVRPAIVNTNQYVVGYEPPQWVNIAYYSISGWFVFSALLSGARIILEIVADSKAHKITTGSHTLDYIMLFVCAVELIIGIGLVLKVGIVRAIAKFFCAVQIFFGLFWLIFAIPGLFVLPLVALLYAGQCIFDIVSAMFMLYLISETDSCSIV